ncbi:MAG: hypothetical protein ACKV2Q_17320 [Planctomycetaceae bacterium]
MPIIAETDFSPEHLFEVSKKLPRDGRLVLIEKLAASLCEDDPTCVAGVNRDLETIGLREEDWPDTPENREEILRRMAAVEPLELTEEDEARIATARAEMKTKSIETMRQLMGSQP